VLVNTPLLAVDAPSLYFRAFHGIPTTAATAADGTPVNAVRGFLDMLTTVIRNRAPGRLVCALDADWRPEWRVALLPSYKTHRVAAGGGEQVPELLVGQIPVILDLLTAVGIPAVGVAGYEADDVLGTLAATSPGPVEVVSGDRDLFQLVRDSAEGSSAEGSSAEDGSAEGGSRDAGESGAPVRLLYCGRGVARLEVCDDAAVRARFGVPAAAYVDYAVLRGDPSDGLPGVSGVGDKTAARLVTRYGSLAAILAALDDPDAGFAPGLRGKLAAARDYLAVAPRVVRVARDVSLPPLEPGLPVAPTDPDRLLELAERWNLAGPCQRMVEALPADRGRPPRPAAARK
jgi:5'-3' exonuclease